MLMMNEGMNRGDLGLDLNLDWDLDLNESPQGFVDDSISSVKDELRKIMLQHEITFRNQVYELHRLYWKQNKLMNDACTKMSSCSPSFRDLSEEMNVEGVKSCLHVVETEQWWSSSAQLQVNDRRSCRGDSIRYEDDEDNVWEAKDSSCDESISRSDRFDKVCAFGESNALYCNADLNLVPVIDLEDPSTLKSNEEASTSRSSGFRMPTHGRADTSCPIGSVITDFGSISGLQNNGLDYHTGEGQLKNTGHIDTGLEYAGGLPLTTPQMQKQQPKHKILQIDLNLSLDEECSDSFRDSPQIFPSPSACSSIVYNGRMGRELRSQVTSDPPSSSQHLQKCISTNQTDVELIGSETLIRCKNANSPLKQSSADSNARNYGKSILDEKVCNSSVESPVKCCKIPGETCPSMASGGSQNSTNVTTLPFTTSDGPQVKNVDSCFRAFEHNPESHSSKQASRETSNNDAGDNCLHESTESTDRASNKEKQQCHNGSEDTLSSHAIDVHAAQYDELDSSLDKHMPDQIGSRSLTGNKGPSAGPESITNDESLIGPISGNLDPGQLCRKGETICEASDCVSLDDQYCATGVSYLQVKQPVVAQKIEHAVKRAAETLIIFNSVNTARPNYTCSIDDNETESTIGVEQPQFSIDSFEKQTLKLEEVKDDGSSISDRQQCHTENVNTACVVKLGRGRGRGRAIRDFQKDVLPGLISLSRHEICEDIHSINYQIKRNEPQKTIEETVRVTTRSKRSRLRS